MSILDGEPATPRLVYGRGNEGLTGEQKTKVMSISVMGLWLRMRQILMLETAMVKIAMMGTAMMKAAATKTTAMETTTMNTVINIGYTPVLNFFRPSQLLLANITPKQIQPNTYPGQPY